MENFWEKQIMNIQDGIIFFMEILGTIAFAASGAMVGIRKQMDIFGICVLGVVTAVGGGMTRDVILGKLPSALEKPVYVVVSVITSLAIFVLLYIKHDLLSGRLGTFYDKAMLIMDSVGLGIFTSLGVMSGIDNGYPDNSFLLVFIGMLTGVGGGLMRDMMAGEEPYIFVKHIYACASLVGALGCVWIYRVWGRLTAVFIGAFIVMAIRFLAAHYRWNLPHPKSSS